MTDSNQATQAGHLIASGSYSIEGERFLYNPKEPKDQGKDVKLPVAVIETLTSTVIQSWNISEGSQLQKFTWNAMPVEFWNILNKRWLETKATSDTLHRFTFHCFSPEEEWYIHIEDLTGIYKLGCWQKVEFIFRLVSQII